MAPAGRTKPSPYPRMWDEFWVDRATVRKPGPRVVFDNSMPSERAKASRSSIVHTGGALFSSAAGVLSCEDVVVACIKCGIKGCCRRLDDVNVNADCCGNKFVLDSCWRQPPAVTHFACRLGRPEIKATAV